MESTEAFARENRVDLILPMTDATTWPLASHSDRFSGIGHLGVSTPGAVERSSDKYWAIATAREDGIPAPETLLIRGLEDLEPARVWGFPVVVKDRFSIRWANDRGIPGLRPLRLLVGGAGRGCPGSAGAGRRRAGATIHARASVSVSRPS